MRKTMLGAVLAPLFALCACAGISPNGTVTLTPTGQTVANDIKGGAASRLT